MESVLKRGDKIAKCLEKPMVFHEVGGLFDSGKPDNGEYIHWVRNLNRVVAKVHRALASQELEDELLCDKFDFLMALKEEANKRFQLEDQLMASDEFAEQFLPPTSPILDDISTLEGLPASVATNGQDFD